MCSPARQNTHNAMPRVDCALCVVAEDVTPMQEQASRQFYLTAGIIRPVHGANIWLLLHHELAS